MTKKPGFKNKDLEKAMRDPMFDDWDLDLVRAFSTWADEEMDARLKRDVTKISRIRDKIARGVEIRLDVLDDYKHHVKTATRAMAHFPQNRHMPKLVWNTADIIWRRAGDTATDYNRYTKRILLSAVLTTTTLYWLRDNSAGHRKTAEFLQKRIDNVLSAGKFLSRFKKSA